MGMPRKGEEIIDVKCTFEYETDKAWRVTPDGSKYGLWVPKSKAEIDPESPVRGMTVTITIEPGFAEHIGLV